MSISLGLASFGLAGMYARSGEVQGMRTAENSGIPCALSTVGVCSLEEFDATTTKPFWFQLYMIRDRSFM